MRTLLLLLILANLGVFAWFFWVAPEANGIEGQRVSADPGKPLYLAGEDPELPDALPAPTEDDGAILAGPAADGAGESASIPSDQPADTVADEQDADALVAGSAQGEARGETAMDDEPGQQPAAVCASLGPFDDEALAQTVVGRLLEQGYVPELRSTGGQIRSGYWVYLPPFQDRDTAKATESRLRERGVKDLFIVTGDENRNAISLGLFSTAERADQRAAEIGRLGFSPRIAERFRDATVYWVDFREKPGEELQPESIGVLDAADLLPEKRQVACEPE